MGDSFTIRCGHCGREAQVAIPPGAFDCPGKTIYTPPGWHIVPLGGLACSEECRKHVRAAHMYAWGADNGAE